MKIKHQSDVLGRRAQAYPPFDKLADAIYHERMGNPKPMKAWMKAVEAVKKKLPKSEK